MIKALAGISLKVKQGASHRPFGKASGHEAWTNPKIDGGWLNVLRRV
jgi:hypothetical protein